MNEVKANKVKTGLKSNFQRPPNCINHWLIRQIKNTFPNTINRRIMVIKTMLLND